MGHRNPVEVKEALNESINQANSRTLEEIPSSVEADLMPNLDSNVASEQGTSKRFRIQANAVDARSFFASLVKGTEYSVAIHPSVQGNITVNLSDVTLDEVLNVVQNMYGYDVVKSGKVIQIYPAGMRTVTIPVDYLQFALADQLSSELFLIRCMGGFIFFGCGAVVDQAERSSRAMSAAIAVSAMNCQRVVRQ